MIHFYYYAYLFNFLKYIYIYIYRKNDLRNLLRHEIIEKII